MGRLLDLVMGWLSAFFDITARGVGSVLATLEPLARELGLPPEVLAGGVLCLILIALWRGLGGRWN